VQEPSCGSGEDPESQFLVQNGPRVSDAEVVQNGRYYRVHVNKGIVHSAHPTRWWGYISRGRNNLLRFHQRVSNIFQEDNNGKAKSSQHPACQHVQPWQSEDQDETRRSERPDRSSYSAINGFNMNRPQTWLSAQGTTTTT
jgi:hypothetical protein